MQKNYHTKRSTFFSQKWKRSCPRARPRSGLVRPRASSSSASCKGLVLPGGSFSFEDWRSEEESGKPPAICFLLCTRRDHPAGRLEKKHSSSRACISDANLGVAGQATGGDAAPRLLRNATPLRTHLPPAPRRGRVLPSRVNKPLPLPVSPHHGHSDAACSVRPREPFTARRTPSPLWPRRRFREGSRRSRLCTDTCGELPSGGNRSPPPELSTLVPIPCHREPRRPWAFSAPPPNSLPDQVREL